MKNKPIFFLGILIFIMTILSVNVLAENPAIDLDYTPYPSHAGDLIELQFFIQNTGSSALENLTFQLNVDTPFTLDSIREQHTSLIDVDETKILKIEECEAG